MEVNKKPTLIREYWPRFRRRGILITILMQVVGTLTIGFVLISTTTISTTTITFWMTLLAILATSIGINLLLFNLLSAPLKDLTGALTHVSNEPTIVTPPNPNAQRFERDGFKPLLQLIYKMASDEGSDAEVKKAVAATTDFATALNNATAGFIVLDSLGRVTYSNEKAPVHSDPDGAIVIDLLFDADDNLNSWLKDCAENAVHAEHSWKRIANKITGEEGRKIYDISASYQKGSAAEVVMTLFEQTDVYLPEDEDLDFIAFAAHELRGPITVIRGYLDVLSDELEDALDADQIELMSRLVVSANRLSSYVNNILNASRYDRRHLKVHLRESTIADIYDTISDDMQLRASSQNRMLSVALSDALPTVAADRASVSEVISNLIDNAIKYSNEGGLVNITADVDGDFVKVSVEDHGIGMPGNVVSNLFHKFYRSHRSRETVAGTGIGLYICKAIVESHGGKISVRSAENEGSTFAFTLPIYSTVAEKLKADDNSNESLIDHDENGWIKNHSMYRG
jgi:signal transduction histidine kinase